jgi:hypothetical protein
MRRVTSPHFYLAKALYKSIKNVASKKPAIYENSVAYLPPPGQCSLK